MLPVKKDGLFRTKKEALSIGLGMHDIENPNEGLIVPIEKVILHQAFESDYLHDTHDISLIKLKNPVPFSENIRPVCLPHKGKITSMTYILPHEIFFIQHKHVFLAF